MGGYVKNNSVDWNITATEEFSQQNLSYWEERIEDLERVQIDNYEIEIWALNPACLNTVV